MPIRSSGLSTSPVFPASQSGMTGNISPEWALADAKLSEAETIDEAISWLQPKERMAILQDQALIAHLARLPKAPPRMEDRPLAE